MEEALRVENLRVEYKRTIAVNDISFAIKKGEIFSLVGESGCGKTTTAKAILLDRKAAPLKEGRVFFFGREITKITGKEEKDYRRRAKIIFQNPYNSLHASMRVRDLMGEPLVIHGVKEARTRTKMVVEALESVKLIPAQEFLDKYPHQLSGGQLQRVCIARKLVLKPEFIAADEPVSMLDMSTRAGILDLILELREKHQITFLFITHDLAVAKHLSDRMGVMYCGRLVEIGPAKEVIDNPRHPYTKALVVAVPNLDPKSKIGEIPIKGEIFDFAVPEQGCGFAPRCLSCFPRCSQEIPKSQLISLDHFVSCHLYREGVRKL